MMMMMMMKLGRWGWGLKRLSFARFQRNRAMGFGDSAKNGSQRRCFFVTWTTHHFCHFPWIDFRQTSHEHVFTWWLATYGFIFQKFSLRDRICRITPFLGYGTLFVLSLRVTGNVLRRLHSFRPLRWRLLRDTVFHLSTSESVLISNGDTWMGTQSRHPARGGTLKRLVE